MPAIHGALHAPLLHFSDYQPDQITQAQIREYIAKRPYYGKDPTKPRPVAKSTIDKELRFIRQVLRYGEREGWGVTVPAFQAVGSNPPRERWLTRAEYDAIHAHAAPHIQLFMTVALHTAQRKSAVLEMKWSQVDFERGIIWAEGGNAIKRRTSVTMGPKLADPLKTAHTRAKTPYVIEYKGKPVKDVKRGWTRAKERAGVKDARIHDLRRTAASWMLNNGASFAQVAAVLGDSEEMVRKHYGKFSPGFMRAAVDLIE